MKSWWNVENKPLKKKSKTWRCPKKCKLGDKPCRHLEKLLPSLDRGKLSGAVLTEYRYVSENTEVSVDFSPEFYAKIERGLASRGFRDYEINLIMDRFVSRMTIGEITEKHNYLSSGTVSALLAKLTKVINFMGEEVE
jgi:hypothetical protein